MLNSYKLAAPVLNWGSDGVPRSDEFDDVYFDKEAGLEESKYVFLHHNDLEKRFQALSLGQTFCIAETGFGTGLNFLCALKLFNDTAPKGAKLHFVSIEKFPLSKATLEQALRSWPSLESESRALLADYPELCLGLHTMDFIGDNITLSLYFGEASDGFEALNGKVDAWFLDGFAPSKNPEMWSEALFSQIQRLSTNGTTFATFTAAGIVRRGLKSHGFDVRKVKGFGHKREMAVGYFNVSDIQSNESRKPWFHIRHSQVKSDSNPKRALVVGAGIAGTTTARALADQGITVDVWERNNQIASEASGNAQGMLYPKLANQDTPVNRFYLASYLYANRFYNHYQKVDGENDGCTLWWKQSGLHQHPKNEQEVHKLSQIIDKNLYPVEIVRSHDKGGLFLPLSGWIRPAFACSTLVKHPNIQVSLNKSLECLTQTENGKFDAFDGERTETFDYVVICSANDHSVLDEWLPIATKPIRGQVSSVSLETLAEAAKSKDSLSFSNVLCGQGYVSPQLDGTFHFGATYDLKNQDSLIREEDHSQNLEKLSKLVELNTDKVDTSKFKGRASVRCTVPDYCPIVGPVTNKSEMLTRFSELSKNAKWQSDDAAPLLNGLYVNIGHGSRGLVSAPLSARYIASLIAQQLAPIEQSCIEALHPSRFVVRALKRGDI